MKFAVFGATGRVGRHVLTAALDAGHSVSVLVRDTRRLPVIARSGLTIREGAVDDPSLVAATLAGADACICCLAAGNNLLTRFGRVAIPQLEHSGPRRLVVIAGASLRRPEDPPAVSLAVMSTIMRMVPGRMLDDVAGLVRQLEASRLDWTVVRSANHTDAPVGPVHAAAGFQMKMSATVSRQALAAFLLAIAGDGRFIREAPMVEAANVS